MLPTRNKFYASRICNQKSPETDHFYTSPKPIYEQHRPTPSDHTFRITRVPRTWVSEVPKWKSSEDRDDGELPSGSGRLELIHKSVPAATSGLAGASHPSLPHYIRRLGAKNMFRKNDPTKSGSNLGRSRRKWTHHLLCSQHFDDSAAPLVTKRVADSAKITLDIAKESADWFPPLKAALGGVSALVRHYEVLFERTIIVHNLLIRVIAGIQRCQRENRRS